MRMEPGPGTRRPISIYSDQMQRVSLYQCLFIDQNSCMVRKGEIFNERNLIWKFAQLFLNFLCIKILHTRIECFDFMKLFNVHFSNTTGYINLSPGCIHFLPPTCNINFDVNMHDMLTCKLQIMWENQFFIWVKSLRIILTRPCTFGKT